MAEFRLLLLLCVPKHFLACGCELGPLLGQQEKLVASVPVCGTARHRHAFIGFFQELSDLVQLPQPSRREQQCYSGRAIRVNMNPF